MSQLTISPQNNALRPLRVLMVEDDADDAELEIEQLRNGGFAPVFKRVETHSEMQNALYGESWDLILSDYSMPLFSAPDALEVLKQSELDIPFIIVSGTVGEETAVAALKAGANDFLVKGQYSRLVPAVMRELSEAEGRRTARTMERKFLSTFEQAAVGLAHVDAEGQLRLVNHKFCQVLQYDHNALMALSLQELICPDDLDQNDETYQQLLRREISNYSAERRYIRKDGSLIWVNQTVSIVWNETNGFDYFLVVIEDISQRKQTEQALKESEERFRLMAEQAPIIIWQSDTTGGCTYLNRRWNDFTGQKGAESLGSGWVSAIHPEDAPYTFSVYEQAIQNRERYEVEYRLRRYDGKYHWILASGVPRYTANGDFVGFVGTCHDFTDRKKVEEDLQKYAWLLERRNRELEQFATIASHDLQEPLRKIQVFSDMLYNLVPDEGKDYILRMQKSVKRMQTLISDLLALSRVNRKGQPFKMVDLNKVLEAVLEDMQVAIEEVGATVQVGPLGQVFADEGQVRQLFQNLVDNALKYHREHTPPIVKIYGRAERQAVDGEPCYRTTVEDNGIGIAPEFYERIFEPFQRLHGLSQYPGSGMGLTICKKIMDRHDGTMTVASVSGQGSTFSFTLPVQARSDSTDDISE